MSDGMEAAPSEAATEGVQPVAATAEVEAQNAEGMAPNESGQAPDAPSVADGEKSESQKRRERRKAAQARREAELEDARKREAEAQARKARIESYAGSVTKPNPDDFENPDDYIAANAAYMSQKGLDDREIKAADDEIAQLKAEQTQRLKEGWQSQVEDARERYDNFDAVATSSPISDNLALEIAQMPNGADLAYYLGSNHHEAARLSQLYAVNPMQAAVEIGRLSMLAQAPQPKTQSSAPEPMDTVGGGGARPGKDPSKMSMQEYDAWAAAGYPQ